MIICIYLYIYIYTAKWAPSFFLLTSYINMGGRTCFIFIYVRSVQSTSFGIIYSTTFISRLILSRKLGRKKLPNIKAWRKIILASGWTMPRRVSNLSNNHFLCVFQLLTNHFVMASYYFIWNPSKMNTIWEWK